MGSPRHLWSGDWASESASAEDELARRREHAIADPSESEPIDAADDAQPARVATWRVALAAATRAIARVGRRARLPRRKEVAYLAIVLAAGTGTALAVAALTGGDANSNSISERYQQPQFQLPRPWLGLATASSPARLGALVTQIVPGGPADQAALQQGDVITAINGQPIARPADVAGVIDSQQVGTEVLLQIDRGGQLQTVGVILATRPTGGP
jgi:membrane-associated protease RseP (regulator of RpoE activity)